MYEFLPSMLLILILSFSISALHCVILAVFSGIHGLHCISFHKIDTFSRAVATYEADEANASGNFSASNLPRVNFSPQICLNLASGKLFASHLPQSCLGCFFCLTRCLCVFIYSNCFEYLLLSVG